MATTKTILAEMKKKGTEKNRKTFARHGAPDDLYGVSVADMKVIAKGIKGEQELALALYDSGVADAMYLAGMVVDGSQMTKKQLETWVKNANWQMVSEYTVPWVASENQHGRDLALKWMKSRKEPVASSGWATYSGIVAITPDEELDLDEISDLLDRVVDEIDEAPDRVRYTMNGFVIAVGTYVKPLLRKAKATAKKLGAVSVDMNGTACKVPLATQYIEKVETADRVGKKRKTIRC